jgi:hypothetical protein
MILRTAAFCLIPTLMTAGDSAPAAAQNVVTLCNSDTQVGDGRNLQQALHLGGRITFACPAQTGTIHMTVGHNIRGGTSLHGDDRITLDARGAVIAMFSVGNGNNFTVERITIRNAKASRPSGPWPGRPSVIGGGGNVTLRNVTIQGSEQAIYIRGRGEFFGSRFLDNDGTALSISGEAQIEDCSFIGNGRGLVLKLGSVRRSHFSGHGAGALYVHFPSGEVRITGSTFDANHGEGALLVSQRSQSGSQGVVTVRRSAFTNNTHALGGGAVNIFDDTADRPPILRETLRQFPAARFEFAYSRFAGNGGQRGGAILADLSNSGGLRIKGGIFVGNQASESGGAIAWQGRAFVLTHSVFRTNRAGKQGGALFGLGAEPGVPWLVANSVFAENEVPAPGGTIEAGPARFFNVTIVNNTGFGIVADPAPGRGPVIANSILSQNRGGNCRAVQPTAFQGGNLQFGHWDCPGVPVGDPYLDEIYAPRLGSPALHLGDLATCVAPPVSRTDIAFQGRGFDGTCALGAFEYPPLKRVSPEKY